MKIQAQFSQGTDHPLKSDLSQIRLGTHFEIFIEIAIDLCHKMCYLTIQ